MRGRNDAERGPELPEQIKEEIGPLLSMLGIAGWVVNDSSYDPNSFGNWYADLTRGNLTIRLVKDRSQYYVSGPTESLKATGLWKSYPDLADFCGAVAAWANEQPRVTKF
jgi:hypothetical protein